MGECFFWYHRTEGPKTVVFLNVFNVEDCNVLTFVCLLKTVTH